MSLKDCFNTEMDTGFLQNLRNLRWEFAFCKGIILKMKMPWSVKWQL